MKNTYSEVKTVAGVQELVLRFNLPFQWQKVKSSVDNIKRKPLENEWTSVEYEQIDSYTTRFLYTITIPPIARVVLPETVTLVDVQVIEEGNERLTQKGENLTFSSFCKVQEEAVWAGKPNGETEFTKRVFCNKGCKIPSFIQRQLLRMYLKECEKLRMDVLSLLAQEESKRVIL
mmetsp:Transcript_9174/g.10477  ORF Transcript_9174/g.10477 Transcript_9174/m.10477 type:complete len:175 (+) Transcript_9174:77-601(+)